MQITRLELNRLNFYRASQLHGGLVLGQLARRVRDGDLIMNLTRHGAEELEHARIWTETILALGGDLRPIRSTYQARLAHIVGTPASVFQVLALTQVFERRVFRHFIQHARMAGTHELVRSALERMIEKEKGHLSWLADWLQVEAARRRIDVHAVLDRFSVADARVYGELIYEYRFRTAA
jgi:bacterioferritin (cytochrome b1)